MAKGKFCLRKEAELNYGFSTEGNNKADSLSYARKYGTKSIIRTDITTLIMLFSLVIALQIDLKMWLSMLVISALERVYSSITGYINISTQS